MLRLLSVGFLLLAQSFLSRCFCSRFWEYKRKTPCWNTGRIMNRGDYNMLYEKYKVEPSDQLAFNLDTRSLWLETIAWIEANPEAFARLSKYALNEYERGGKASSRSWAARERFDNRISIRNEMTPILSRICEQYCGIEGVFTQSKSVYDGIKLNENERAEMKAYLGW